MSADTFAGIPFRCVGPSLMAGRIGDIAVHPRNRYCWYIAVASGGVWKTTNAGTTWTPVFDGQGSFSIGCVAIDQKNPHVVWVGSGENNSQRSVDFGDGVYRSRDGGASWENMGLADSEHIGMIRIDPRDSDVVYVAAQGPLWRSGDERGLYKTTNGGKTWNKVLDISKDTGINEVHMDPRDPDVLYASAYQRRRHVWTLINGGPESAVYKSHDAGKTWRKLSRGLPEGDMGRIGLTVSPANPDVLYAMIEAGDDKTGIYRSLDRGETWEKRNGFGASSPQYYNEIVADPRDPDRVFAMDTFLVESLDGAKTFKRVTIRNMHVDNHAVWIDPDNTQHLLVGCDGGLYETFDNAANWHYKSNMPITQFYRVTADNSRPFYYVYGGTQDNNTLGGPSRTLDRMGIGNEHWFVTVGGDGFKPLVDPEDPNIIYSQWQYGMLVRHDRKTGEVVDIKPREAPDEPPLRWNWDSALIISPHDRKRLYFASNKLFRSNNAGDSWTQASPDLTRQLDRNTLPVMGRVQPADAIAKHMSTSFYGNIVSLSESPIKENLLYVGTDDGLIQISADAGGEWKKVESVGTVPEMTYVSCLFASRFDADTVFAAFDNHKRGDFAPYLYRSTDRGATWTDIAGNLPRRDIVYTFVEDTVRKDLWFCGTEFGVYFTIDGGKKWIKLKGGLPTIAVRDMEIQAREGDLVIATFGRGIYILDDLTPLREASRELLDRDVALLPVKPALRYVEMNRLGDQNGRGTQGASYYAAANPAFGATFTYYMKEKLTTRKERRKEQEKELRKKGQTPPYPTMDQLRAEDQEKEPAVVAIIKDPSGATIRRVPASRDKGLRRISWDLRYPSASPVQLTTNEERAPWETGPIGPLASPGMYTVALAKEVDGVVTMLTDPVRFEVRPLGDSPATPDATAEVLAFRGKVADMQRAVEGAQRAAGEAVTRLKHLRKAIIETPSIDPATLAEAQQLESRLMSLSVRLNGDATRIKRNEPWPLSISERLDSIVGSQWYTTTAPTKSQREEYRRTGTEFESVLAGLRTLIESDVAQLERKLEAAGAPWTPGRVPTWQLSKD